MYVEQSRSPESLHKQWMPARISFTPGTANIIHKLLVPANNVLLPPLHIKLGLMRQYVKALDKEKSEAYKFIKKRFPNKTDAKIKGGVFDGPN